MIENKFLLFYRFENDEGRYECDYDWFDTIEQLKEKAKDLDDIVFGFKILDVIEILQAREIKIE